MDIRVMLSLAQRYASLLDSEGAVVLPPRPAKHTSSTIEMPSTPLSSTPLKCPSCGTLMQSVGDIDMQICPNCKTLAWQVSGKLEWRVPQRVSEEELAAMDAVPEYPDYIVPHADHGDPECCGLIMAEIDGEQAKLICNECGTVMMTVPAREANLKLAELSSGEIWSETCPHCGQLNIFPGFSVMMAYVCKHCGQGVGIEPSAQ